MLGDMERTRMQETGELTIDPRTTVAEICDLLSDLGLILDDDVRLFECQTKFGIGFRLEAKTPNASREPKSHGGWGKRAVDAGTPDRGQNDDETDAVDAIANILHFIDPDGEGKSSVILSTAAGHYESELK